MNLNTVTVETEEPDAIIGIKDGYPVRVPVRRSSRGRSASDGVAEVSTSGGLPSIVTPTGVIYPLATTGQALTANDFRGSRQRGLNCDPLSASARSAEYVALFGRFGANLARRFITPTASRLGGAYPLEESIMVAFEQELASFAAAGARTIVVAEPFGPGGSQRRDASFFNSAAARAAFVAWWSAFAARWRGDPRIAGFDIINEPYNPDPAFAASQAGTDQILSLQAECIAAIRAADPTRVCVVTCGQEGAPGAFTQMRPLPFENLVYTFHGYQPYVLTHANVGGQQAYAGGYPSADVVAGEFGSGVANFAPSLANRSRMLADYSAPAIFSRRYGVPILVGEFAAARGLPSGVAAAWTEDAISVFNELGFSWCHFGFWFLPNPWDSLVLDSSTELIAFDNGSTSGSVSLASLTGGGASGRTPIAPVSHALQGVSLAPFASTPAPASVYVEESFEATLGRLGGAGGSTVVDSGMTLVLNSTAAPASGARHARATHVSGAGSLRSYVLLQDTGVGKTAREYFFSKNVALRTAIAAGADIVIFQASTNGEGSGASFFLRNVVGTNTWLLDVRRGSGDFASRPQPIVTGLSLPVGSYTNLKLAWLNDTSRGRIRVWQDRKLLVDINTFPTTTQAGDRMWRPAYGLVFSNQIGMQIDFDDVKFSADADLT